MREDRAPYIAAWRERRCRAVETQSLRVEMGRSAVHQYARILVERYGAQRVWLFGSLSRRRVVHPRSDIDLAVEGLPPKDYFRALAALWKQLPPGFDLDLVPLEMPGRAWWTSSNGRGSYSMNGHRHSFDGLRADIRRELADLV